MSSGTAPAGRLYTVLTVYTLEHNSSYILKNMYTVQYTVHSTVRARTRGRPAQVN
eukprot:COSAG05_NODE_664_length_8020_cov_31.425578_5_plen_55_part_00